MSSPSLRQRSPLRVVVAEDNDQLRRRLAAEIDSQADMHCVACVAAPEQVLQAARSARADVVVLDLMLDGGNALHLIRELRGALACAHVIVHSSYSRDVLGGEALRRGASGYVTKTGDLEVLLLEIREACYCSAGMRA